MSDNTEFEGKAEAPLPSFRLETLKKRAEFKAAASGARFSTPAFTLQRRPDGEAPATAMRFGFTVTKKVGNSVERNRIRRRLREAVRAAAPMFPPRAMEIVVVARREALVAAFPALVEDIGRGVNALAEKGAPSKARTGPKKPRAMQEPALKAGNPGQA